MSELPNETINQTRKLRKKFNVDTEIMDEFYEVLFAMQHRHDVEIAKLNEFNMKLQVENLQCDGDFATGKKSLEDYIK